MIEKIDYTGMRETDRRAGEWVVRKEDGKRVDVNKGKRALA